MDKETKDIIGLLSNLAFPGIGTIIWGDKKEGIIQLTLYLTGLVLSLVIIGVPLVVGIWMWALVKGIQRVSKNQ